MLTLADVIHCMPLKTGCSRPAHHPGTRDRTRHLMRATMEGVRAPSFTDTGAPRRAPANILYKYFFKDGCRMPELPEVEYVARQLRNELVGRTISEVEVRWPRAISQPAPEQFRQGLLGRRCISVGRRAKYMLIGLDDGHVLVVHRRMSGNLILLKPGEDEPYIRVLFTLDDGRQLAYTDPRKFGRLLLVPGAALEQALPALGPEPLEPSFTPAVLRKRLSPTRRPLKAALLDQGVLAGLGNIYADEALFLAKLHPLQPACSLTPREATALHAGIQMALRTGIEHGGTTFGRHRDAFNEAGRNLEHVQVYRRTGLPCPRCGHGLERITVAQRSTHFCPHCQRLHIRRKHDTTRPATSTSIEHSVLWTGS